MAFTSGFEYRIFCDANFSELVDLVSGFLTSHRWVVEPISEERYRTFRYSDFQFHDVKRHGREWPRGKATVLSAPARCIANVYGDALFSIHHLRREWAQGYLPMNSFPLSVRQRFHVCPNVIEVEHSDIRMAGDMHRLGKLLLDWLVARHRNAYICNFEGAFLDIIATGYKDPAEAADEIHKLVQGVLRARGAEDIDLSVIPGEFQWLLPRLCQETILALQSAEMIRAACPQLPDCSAVVIEYCKAVEIELEDKLLRPLRAYWQTTTLPAGYTVPAGLVRLRDYVNRPVPKQIELGTLAKILEEAMANSSDIIANSLLRQVEQMPFPKTASTQLSADVLYLTREFRNPAAHKAILSADHLKDCRDLVIGTDSKLGLLARIVKSA